MILKIKIQPNAKKNEILEKILIDEQEYLKVKIKAPAVDNKANNELLAFLAKTYGIAKKDIKIVKGEKTSLKILEINE